MITLSEKERKKRVKIDEEMIQKINEEYAECANMAEVARRLGISSSTVKKYLNEDNLSIVDREYDDFDALWFYVYRLFGKTPEGDPVSKWNITQMKRFRTMGISYRAQLLTLKFFYEVEKNPIKKEYCTVGIIPYILDRSKTYYEHVDKKQEQIIEEIEKQLEIDRKEIPYDPSKYRGNKRKKKTIDLDSIGDES